MADYDDGDWASTLCIDAADPSRSIARAMKRIYLNAPFDPLLGSVIDERYLVLEMLGAGGMGVVYAAMQLALDRPVAVKVVRPELAAEEEAAARLLREARTAGSLGDPGIAAVHDVGRLADGRPYLVMDQLDGPSLADVIAYAAPMDPARVVGLLRGPALALAAAHARGIVHRDVKPDNLVLVRGTGGGERVVLLDFGLAAFCEPGPLLERLTRAGTIVGTPDYMAPECVTGDRPVTPSCDVYALACVAFEMLTGNVPFQATNAFALLRLKAACDPPSLAAASGIAFADPFEEVLAHGIARDPAERFDTPAAFVHALSEATRMAGRDRCSA